MAVGRNRNKIYAIAVASFWITVWATVFTLPYLYYSAGLGPKTGFIYTGLCFVSLSYVYFCVGEVTGRTMEEIEGFFANVSIRIPPICCFDCVKLTMNLNLKGYPGQAMGVSTASSVSRRRHLCVEGERSED